MQPVPVLTPAAAKKGRRKEKGTEHANGRGENSTAGDTVCEGKTADLPV